MRRLARLHLPAIALATLASLAMASRSARADAGPDAGSDAITPPAPTTDVVNATACSKLDKRCQRGAFTVSKSVTMAGDFDFDTGWLPKDSAVQVRLLAYLHGRTRVDMSGNLDATWPDAIRLRPDGINGTGVLAIDDGLVVKAMGKFKVTVAGKEFAWTGDLPGIPGVDLASKTTVIFDPWAWKGGVGTPEASGKTKQIELAKVPLTDAIIPIPGIEGGFQLEGQAEFAARYASLRIAFDELLSKGSIVDVDSTRPFTSALFSSSPSLETTLFVHGEMTRQTTLHFIPGFYFEILGKKFDLELVDVPVPIPASTKDWDFAPVTVHFPLPRIEAKPNPIDLGDIPVGKATSVLVTVFDTGEAELAVDASDPNGTLDIATTHLDIGGGSSDSVRATLTPKDLGPIETTLVLSSNDPAAPKLSIKVRANGSADAPAGDDAATEAAGGCGCRTGASAGSPAWLAVAALALLARRRR
ncbi:MAG: hypothetical protein HYV09_16125 [Deltaproteobacteria bacterium]|nr:hypothetical protein [Deltaproteobacteria bacterium]